MVYLHIPFCKSFCTYCGFYSEVLCKKDEGSSFELYADRLCDEINKRKEEISATSLTDTLYIGGGTPSVLPLSVLERIVAALEKDRYTEFTIEVNPEDVIERKASYLKGLKDLCVNRISLGVQSLNDDILRWMNRRHCAATARNAFFALRDVGFHNISVDIIFGVAGLKKDMLRETLTEICKLSPEHISAYQLGIDEGSTLSEMVTKGQYTEAAEDECAEQYRMLCSMLRDAGYEHYEISNWAKPGFASIHNSAYWQRVPYIGIGAGAHSFDGKNCRSWNSPDFRKWTLEKEFLSPTEEREEEIMLGLRTSKGIPTSLCRRKDVENLILEKALIRSEDGTRIRIPEDRFFVADEIIRELF